MSEGSPTLAQQLEGANPRALLELVRSARARARTDFREALRLHWDERLLPATVFFGNGQEIAMGALSDARRSLEPADAMWLLVMLSDLFIQSRRRVVGRIREYAVDRREIGLAPNDEEPTQPRRVCDVAYLQARRLLELPSAEIDVLRAERLFLDLPPDERDRLIADFFASPPIKTSLGEEPDDE